MNRISHLLLVRHLRLTLFLLVFVQLVLVNQLLWDVQPPGLIKPVVRVLAPESELVHSRLSPYGPGLERELVELFARQAEVHPVWVHIEGTGKAWDELRTHRADLLVGVGSAPFRPFLDSLVSPVTTSPVYARHSVGVAHQRRDHPPQDLADLCLRQVLPPQNPLLRETFSRLRDDRKCAEAAALLIEEETIPVQFAALIESEARFAFVDTSRFSLWEPFFTDFQMTGGLETALEYRWFWRSERNQLAPQLDEFWENLIQDSELARIQDKYTGFLPESSDRFALLHFLETLGRELPKYEETIRKAALRYDLDPLLLIALIYHESRFDPGAVSRTGVRGIMQITRITAQELGLDDPMDPHQSILAGARYLRRIHNRLDRPDLAVWDRWFLTLSAYNQGLGHTWDAMALAGKLGLRETSWKDVKSVFPLLSQEAFSSKARHGSTRGFEAVAHVEAIRYYYYILHGLIVLELPEWEHLARLGLPRILS